MFNINQDEGFTLETTLHYLDIKAYVETRASFKFTCGFYRDYYLALIDIFF